MLEGLCPLFYACLTRKVGDKHHLIHAFPFAIGEALALEQLYAGTRHTVSQQQTQSGTGGCYVAQLAPKKVARLIAAHLAVGSGSALVALYIKSIVVDVYRLGVWIVAIYVNMGMKVFPVNIIVRIPFTLKPLAIMPPRSVAVERKLPPQITKSTSSSTKKRAPSPSGITASA